MTRDAAAIFGYCIPFFFLPFCHGFKACFSSICQTVSGIFPIFFPVFLII